MLRTVLFVALAVPSLAQPVAEPADLSTRDRATVALGGVTGGAAHASAPVAVAVLDFHVAPAALAAPSGEVAAGLSLGL